VEAFRIVAGVLFLFGVLPSEHPYGVSDPADAAWRRARLSAHPVASMAEPVRRAAPAAAALPRTYVECTATGWFAASAARARAEGGWGCRGLAAVHDAMVTAPRALTDVLLELAPARAAGSGGAADADS
jgi:hypothetical protein